MARASKDIKSVVIKARSTHDVPEASVRRVGSEEVEIDALVSTIESQRAALEQRAKGMLALQSDIMSMGKLLEEEKRRRNTDSSQLQKLLTENNRLRFQISEMNAGQNKLLADREDMVPGTQAA